MKKSLFILLFLVLQISLSGQKTGSWGDQANGTYINPVLNSDYSDPDVIRVDNKYYMVCSEFHFMRIPVLESDDMVNWKIIGKVYDNINFPGFDTNEKYGRGSWAPALRFHDNKFWIYFCTPDEGLFMSSSLKAEGPWEPLVMIKGIAGWEDPCPFWDDNGTGYLGHSKVGAGPIIIHKLSPDNKQFQQFGEPFTTSAGYWKGTRISLFSFVETNEGGSAAFNWFTYNYDGPKGKN